MEWQFIRFVIHNHEYSGASNAIMGSTLHKLHWCMNYIPLQLVSSVHPLTTQPARRNKDSLISYGQASCQLVQPLPPFPQASPQERRLISYEQASSQLVQPLPPSLQASPSVQRGENAPRSPWLLKYTPVPTPQHPLLPPCPGPAALLPPGSTGGRKGGPSSATCSGGMDIWNHSIPNQCGIETSILIMGCVASFQAVEPLDSR